MKHTHQVDIQLTIVVNKEYCTEDRLHQSLPCITSKRQSISDQQVYVTNPKLLTSSQ